MDFGTGSAIQAAREVMAGLGVDLKDSVLERFLLQSKISMNKRVECKKKSKFVAIK